MKKNTLKLLVKHLTNAPSLAFREAYREAETTEQKNEILRAREALKITNKKGGEK